RSAEPVRVDRRRGERKVLVSLMVVDDHRIEAEPFRLGERFDAGGTAINSHEKLSAAGGERTNRLFVRTKAFENAIRNMNHGFDPSDAQEACEQSRRRRSIHVIVAEDRYGLAAHDG